MKSHDLFLISGLMMYIPVKSIPLIERDRKVKMILPKFFEAEGAFMRAYLFSETIVWAFPRKSKTN